MCNHSNMKKHKIHKRRIRNNHQSSFRLPNRSFKHYRVMLDAIQAWDTTLTNHTLTHDVAMLSIGYRLRL